MLKSNIARRALLTFAGIVLSKSYFLPRLALRSVLTFVSKRTIFTLKAYLNKKKIKYIVSFVNIEY